MLYNLDEIMKIAEDKNIAIGAFNTPNLESLQAVIMAAEEVCVPVIIQFAQCHESWIPLDIIGPIMIEFAKKSTVPICVHLDHGETIEYIKKAIDLGFTSIMYDGSCETYEMNLENTRKIVVMAKSKNVSVEAELGNMGKRESGANDENLESDDTKIYTDPKQAETFVNETNIDALACSFGTTHGIYLSEPKLDFNIVRDVRKLAKNIPIVMHGGSGVSKEDYKKAIDAGVRKINYFTYMDKSGGNGVVEYINKISDEPLFFSAIVELGRNAMKENVKQAIKMFALID